MCQLIGFKELGVKSIPIQKIQLYRCGIFDVGVPFQVDQRNELNLCSYNNLAEVVAELAHGEHIVIPGNASKSVSSRQCIILL